MGRKALGYTAALIALYLCTNNLSNAGKTFTDGANGSSTIIKTLQGR